MLISTCYGLPAGCWQYLTLDTVSVVHSDGFLCIPLAMTFVDRHWRTCLQKVQRTLIWCCVSASRLTPSRASESVKPTPGAQSAHAECTQGPLLSISRRLANLSSTFGARSLLPANLAGWGSCARLAGWSCGTRLAAYARLVKIVASAWGGGLAWGGGFACGFLGGCAGAWTVVGACSPLVGRGAAGLELTLLFGILVAARRASMILTPT